MGVNTFRFGQLGLGWNGEQANFYTPLQILTLHPVVSIAAGLCIILSMRIHLPSPPPSPLPLPPFLSPTSHSFTDISLTHLETGLHHVADELTW
jgi:hypothetical protein